MQVLFRPKSIVTLDFLLLIDFRKLRLPTSVKHFKHLLESLHFGLARCSMTLLLWGTIYFTWILCWWRINFILLIVLSLRLRSRLCLRLFTPRIMLKNILDFCLKQCHIILLKSIHVFKFQDDRLSSLHVKA